MSFAQPAYLFLLLLLVPLAVWYWLKLRHGQPDLQISSVQAFEGAPRSYKYYLRHVPFVLRCLTLALLVVAIARPQSSNSFRNSSVEGIDIMLAIDISGSMLAEDLKPNRLEAAKSVAVEFIEKRPNDRIGLVVFASESFLQCPLTTDHKALISLLEGVQEGMLPDGTAIGLGLATSVSRLKDSETKSKIVILLTDGSNNAGEISPLTAAELARTFGIRAYTIGVGTHGLAPMPFRTNTGAIVYQNVEVNIDENTLRGIADLTGGTYFRATDTDNLRSIYREIDKLEKTRIHDEEFDRR
ncbi:MAG: VWA domain-containing protein, partial [Prevotellaceae bacterium]|nr:VWA domain-containing protein [Prevotellaceae bacterium]